MNLPVNLHMAKNNKLNENLHINLYMKKGWWIK